MRKGECFFFIKGPTVRIEDHKAGAADNTQLLPQLIDKGKLVEMLSKHRTGYPSSLFVSQPPLDNPESVDLGSHAFRRSTVAANIVKAATWLDAMGEYDGAVKEKKAELVFVIVTDGHVLIHSIAEVLKAGIRVELWAWVSAIVLYNRLRARYPSLLSLNPLDEAQGALVWWEKTMRTHL